MTIFPLHEWQPSTGLQGRLVRTEAGTWRTAHPVHGVGAHGVYHRHASREKFEPPYTMHGEILVRDRLDEVWIEQEQRAPTWQWGVTFHPCYPGNANNWNVGSHPGAARTSVFTEIANSGVFTWSRPGHVYRGPPMPLYDGKWHRFRGEVPEHGTFEWYIDGMLCASGHEAVPSFSGPVSVGFRLDFHDIELRDVAVDTHRGITPSLRMEDDMQTLSPAPRIFDTRPAGPKPAGSTTTLPLPAQFRDAKAVAVSVTAVSAQQDGFLTAWGGGSQPEVSFQNYRQGQTIAGFTIVPVHEGAIKVFNSGRTNLLVDVSAIWH